MKPAVVRTFLSCLLIAYANGESPALPCHTEQTWTIAAKFSQGSSVSNVPESYYNAYFRDAVWIKGASEGPPTNTTPAYRSASPYFAVESIDWGSYLVRSTELL